MKIRSKRSDQGFPRLFFFIGSLELVVVAIHFLVTTRGPLTGGLRFSELSVFGFILMISAAFLATGFLFPHSSWLRRNFEKSLRVNEYFAAGSFALAILAFGILVMPAEYLQGLAAYFQALRILLVVISTLPFQFVLLQSQAAFPKIRSQGKLLRLSLGIFLLIVLLFLIIYLTKLGVTPDNWWNVAGTPLTTLQLAVVLFSAVAIVGIGAFIRKRNLLPRSLIVDIFVIISLYLITLILWQQTPMTRHYFSERPSWPAFQPFPISDARVFDLGAISILKGWGINFGSGTQSPLYLIFLAGVRLIAGNDYFLSGDIQIAILALISPTLYLFGKNFHSRTFGIIAALIFLFRQGNAIFLSGAITTSNPRVLMTEVPTLFGLVIVSWAIFAWFKNPQGPISSALIAGGVIGATSLLRLNPILLFPFFLILSLLVSRKYLRTWLFRASIFSAGFLVVLSAWYMTGRDAQNRPYLLLKFYDVINSRYEYELNQLIPQFKPTPHFSGVLRPIPAAPNGIRISGWTEFPFFVVNHGLHNLLGSYMSLPDGFSPADQRLDNLAKRPYLNEDRNAIWQGELPMSQIPMLVVNGLLLSYGIAWSWKRWRLAGLVPLFIVVVYALSLGLARTSGGRYLVPIDWVLPFYYAIALTAAINQFLDPIKRISGRTAKAAAILSERSILILVSCLLAGLTLLVFFADNWVKPETELCDSQRAKQIGQQLASNSASENWDFGQALYPFRKDRTFEFLLLKCRGLVGWQDQDFSANVKHGQEVVVLPESLYELEGTTLKLLWQK